MYLSISSISFPVELADEAEFVRHLAAMGVVGVELDLSRRVDGDPFGAAGNVASARAAAWRRYGLAVANLRADLDGRPGRLFGDDAGRRLVLDDLGRLIVLAASLGAGTISLGSPAARLRGRLAPLAARQVAVPFFREAAALARDRGVTLCLELCPEAHGGDFLTHGHEAAALVEAVDREGLGLSLDTGALLLAGDDADAIFRRTVRYLKHLRLAEPDFGPLGTGGVDFSRIARALQRAGYTGWVTIAQECEVRDMAGLLATVSRLGRCFRSRTAA